MTMMEAVHIDVVGGHAIGRQGNVVICVHCKEPSAPIVQRAYAAANDLYVTQPSGIGLMVVLEAGTAAPDEGAREVITRWKRDQNAGVRAAVLVYEGSGFRAALFRAVILTLTRIGRPKHRDQVCASVTDGADWLTGALTACHAARCSAGELVAAVEQVRARLHPS